MAGSGLAFSLREALRGFARRKSVFAVGFLILALGLSLCTTMLCVLYGVMLRPLSFADPHRLVVAWAAYEGGSGERDSFSEQTLEQWRREGRSFSGLSAFRWTQLTLLRRGEPTDFQGAIVTPEFFSVLGVQATLGGVIGPELARAQQGKVVMLSQWLWRQRFAADPAVVGSGIDLGGEIYTVAGVMPKDFDVPSQQVGFWVPLVSDPAKPETKRKNLTVIGRLRPSVSLAQAQADVDGVARRLAAEFPDTDRGLRIHLVPFFDEMIKDSRAFVLAASGAALLVLLICCANLGNLLLARAIQRRPEVAVRLALGAQRRDLLGAVFTEGLVLAVAGGIAAAGLARWMIEMLVRMTPVELPRSAEIGHGLQIPIVTVLLILFAALLVSAPAALEVARPRQLAGATLGPRAATSRRFARQLMVIIEIAIALTLLVGSALMARTILALRGASPGWRTDHLVAVQIYLPKNKYREPHQIQHFFETLIEQLRVTPGVQAVAGSSGLPAEVAAIDFDVPIQVLGRATETGGQAAVRVVTPGYFQAMGIPLLEGRAFDDRDRDPQARKVMVNRSFVKKFLPEAPSVVGRQVMVFLRAPETYEIVGAVGDVYNAGVLKETKPEFYLPFAAKPISGLGVAVRTTGDPLAFAPVLRDKLRALDAELPVTSVDSMEHMVNVTFGDRTFLASLLVLFAVVAVLLTALGVFSVMSFSVSQQVKEIGIRMAMGARGNDVVNLVMSQAARVALTGVAFGLCGGWLLGRGLASLIYGVSAADPWVFLGGALFIGLVASLGAFLPSRWASRIDPVAALRTE